MSELEKLVGKRLKKITRGVHTGPFPKDSSAYGGVHGQNDKTITFHCENGDYVFVADGDCCSESFIDSVEGPTEGLILELREPEWGAAVRQENDGETKYYKATLVIEGKGALDIEYRNESNGYYGGSLSMVSEPPICKVHEDCKQSDALAYACAASTLPIGGDK